MKKLLNNPWEMQKWKYKGKQNIERFSAARVNKETLNVYRELVPNYNLRQSSMIV